MLKPPGTKHLKLRCDEPLLNLGFNFNLRRYNTVVYTLPFITLLLPVDRFQVGRCRLTLSNPR